MDRYGRVAEQEDNHVSVVNSRKARIKEANDARKVKLIYYQIYLVCFMYWLKDELHMPSAITYITDVIVIMMILFRYNSIKSGMRRVELTVQKNIFSVIVIGVVIGVLANRVDLLLVLWGARNNARFFVFFFLCAGLLEKDDIDALLKFFKFFFWINSAMCAFQYFVQGYEQDFLGGFFGTSRGCNTYVNIMLAFITALVLSEYCTSKIKLGTLVCYIGVCMVLSYMAELKIYYMEFMVIAAIIILMVRPSAKITGLCIAGLLILAIVVYILSKYDPERLEFIFSSYGDKGSVSGNGYTGSGDLNRFTAVQEIYDMFFKGNILLVLFGFGLGSCDYSSSYTFLQSDFYLKYEYLHYRWFSDAWVFLEQGGIGLVMLVLFIASVTFYAYSKRDNERRDLTLAVLAFSPMVLLWLLYNNSLEMDVNYLLAFMLSIPFVINKAEEKKIEREDPDTMARRRRLKTENRINQGVQRRRYGPQKRGRFI